MFNSKSSRLRLFFKIDVLENCLRPATLLKKDSNTDICGIFKNTFVYRTPPKAASLTGPKYTSGDN